MTDSVGNKAAVVFNNCMFILVCSKYHGNERSDRQVTEYPEIILHLCRCARKSRINPNSVKWARRPLGGSFTWLFSRLHAQ